VYTEIGRVRTIDRGFASRSGHLLQEDLRLHAMPGAPVTKPPLQGPRHPSDGPSGIAGLCGTRIFARCKSSRAGGHRGRGDQCGGATGFGAAVGERCREETTAAKRWILDEFVALTRYHPKHAIRVLCVVRLGPPAAAGRLLNRPK
jgi:hypothetical protein